MMTKTPTSFRWFLSLSGKLARVVPLQTLGVVCLTLISQAAMLLSAFLPLKVVILLGSEHIPQYFPASLASLGKDTLIGLLSLGTAGVFALYLLVERWIRSMTALGANRLLQKSHKMALFENQNELAQDAYFRFSRTLANGVFVGLSLVGLAVFYPVMAAVQIVYLVLVGVVLWFLSGTSETVRNYLELRLAQVLASLSGIGFFVAFGYLVIDFILWNPPSVIIGVVSLLLSRQIMQKTTGLVTDFFSLHLQRAKLGALFFHGNVLVPDLANEQSLLWNLLEPSHRESWVSPILREFTAYEEGPLTMHWQQMSVHNSVALKVEAQVGSYLIKLFATNRSSLAIHETTLLLEPLPRLPALPLLGVTQINGLSCLIYSIPAGRNADAATIRGTAANLNGLLMSIRPSSSLQQLYLRSRPMLWQRLTLVSLERIGLAVNTIEEQEWLSEIVDKHAILVERLQGLPLYIHVPDMQSLDIHLSSQDDKFIFLNWTRWSLEPIGAGWPILPYWFEQLDDMLKKAAELCHDLAGVTTKQVELGALSFALDGYCQRQRFSEALSLLPKILERLDPNTVT